MASSSSLSLSPRPHPERMLAYEPAVSAIAEILRDELGWGKPRTPTLEERFREVVLAADAAADWASVLSVGLFDAEAVVLRAGAAAMLVSEGSYHWVIGRDGRTLAGPVTGLTDAEARAGMGSRVF